MYVCHNIIVNVTLSSDPYFQYSKYGQASKRFAYLDLVSIFVLCSAKVTAGSHFWPITSVKSDRKV